MLVTWYAKSVIREGPLSTQAFKEEDKDKLILHCKHCLTVAARV